MESLDLAIYATPTPDGDANQLYMSQRPQFTYDFLIADSADFLEEMGIDTLGWQEMTDAEQEALEEHTPPCTITVPRHKRDREG